MSRLPLPLTGEDRAAGYWWASGLNRYPPSRRQADAQPQTQDNRQNPRSRGTL